MRDNYVTSQPIPDDLKGMNESSKLDTTMFVGSDIRILIGRISRLEKALRQIADHDTQLPWVACARIARLALGSDSAEVEE